MPFSEVDKAQLVARFEELGDPTVRMYVQTGKFNDLVSIEAIRWLAEKDRAAARATEASQAEIALTAARSADASERSASAAEAQAQTAKQALTTARVATAIALAAFVVSVIALLHLVK